MDKILKALQELGLFLGKKYDVFISEMKGVHSVLQDIFKQKNEDTKDIIKMLNSATENLEKLPKIFSRDIVNVLDSVNENLEKLSKVFSKDISFLGDDQKDVARYLNRVADRLSEIDEITINGSVDSESLIKEIKEIAEVIKRNKVVVDFSGVEKKLSILIDKKQEKIKMIDYSEAFEKLQKSLNELKSTMEQQKEIKIKIPDTFKLEEMQLRKLAGASKGISVDGGKMAARNVAITNLALTATNTQYSFTFPANTTAFTIKLRDQGTLAYYSFTTGTLPVVGGGGDGTKYATIPQNYLQSQEGVDWSGKVIYLGAESASQTAEITVFTM